MLHRLAAEAVQSQCSAWIGPNSFAQALAAWLLLDGLQPTPIPIISITRYSLITHDHSPASLHMTPSMMFAPAPLPF